MSLLPSDHRSGLFIRERMPIIADRLVQWGQTVGRGTVAEASRMPLTQAWAHVDDRKPIPDRAFLATVSGGWTGFFDNDLREHLAQAELFVLCEKLRADTCFFSYNHVSDSQRGSGHFCYYRYVGTGDRPIAERQVMCYKESGWVFSQSGDPLPFEDIHAYTRRKKSARLPPELLKSYGTAVNLPFWDPKAYSDEVVLLRWGEHPPREEKKVLETIKRIFGKPWAVYIRGRRME